jgi:hypothetical protein
MHIAEVQVFGSPGTRVRVGRVTDIECGNLVTAITLGPVPELAYVQCPPASCPLSCNALGAGTLWTCVCLTTRALFCVFASRSCVCAAALCFGVPSCCACLVCVCAASRSALELQYRKAVRSDSDAALVLRQLDTYFSLYDEIGRGEKIFACPLCRYGRLCELCYLQAVRWRRSGSCCVRACVRGFVCVSPSCRGSKAVCGVCVVRCLQDVHMRAPPPRCVGCRVVQRWPIPLPPGPFGRRCNLQTVRDTYSSVSAPGGEACVCLVYQPPPPQYTHRFVCSNDACACTASRWCLRAACVWVCGHALHVITVCAVWVCGHALHVITVCAVWVCGHALHVITVCAVCALRDAAALFVCTALHPCRAGMPLMCARADAPAGVGPGAV